MRPVIGITPSPSLDDMPHGSFYRYSLSRTYVNAVRAAGGLPIVLPVNETDVEAALSIVDGLVLSGGGDIDPVLFNAADRHDATYGIDEDRDRFELEAFRIAALRDIPTFCICRGIQVMNVAQGGSLHQHIPDDVAGSLEHRQSKLGLTTDDVSHDVTLAEGNNLLRDILAVDELAVNSYHHQGVEEPGRELETVATSADGVIEGLWHPRMRFGLGVQWHPEMLAGHSPHHAALFRALVHAARPAS